MKYFKKIVGDNLYLSPVCMEDAEEYVKWFSDMKFSERLHQAHRVNNMVSEKEWIENTLSKQEPSFAIVRKDDDSLIGNCGIMNIDSISRTATVGIFIGDIENRGKGYGSEALKLLVSFGVNYLNLNNIDLHVFEFNENAMACYKKVGFKEYGRRHKAYYCDGKYHDIVLMELLKEDFENGCD